MESLRVVNLKALLAGRKLSTAGTKAELITRLLNDGITVEELPQFTNSASMVDTEETVPLTVDNEHVGVVSHQVNDHTRLIEKCSARYSY